MSGRRSLRGRVGRRAIRAFLARGIVAAIVATGAFVSTVAPALATSISEFSSGITSPGAEITYGADGNLWFTEPANPNRIGKITPAGVVTEYTAGLTANAGLGAITAGPDGNVWFTESLSDKIGKITPAGVVTEFAATLFESPTGIAKGPDGNLWYTEDKNGPFGSDEIGRITPTGTVTNFGSGLTAGSTPSAITAGSDGNLWFTEYVGGRIGRVTTAGVITEFADGLPSQSVQGIASGSDGNLWVTETAANEIARVTTGGVATQFSSGITASSLPTAITSGPDGSLWFTESNGNRIGRITPAGTVTEYAAGITPSSSPNGIVMGPDLNLWFTESGGARIGEVYQPGLRGVDVSGLSGTVNWSQVAGAGYSFGYAKLTEGINFTDPNFATNWSAMGAAGMSRGAYLFFHFNLDPTAEADYFLAAFNGAGYTPQDLAPMLDVEVTDGASVATMVANLHTAVNAIQAALGVWPVIYTSPSFWTSTLGNPATFTSDPLWIANWGVRSPAVPASNWGGNGWKLWQYSSSGTVPGIGGAADLDQASWTGLPLIGKGPATKAATSTSQYTLANSDGATWKEIDATKLRITEAPSANQSTLLTANADLFTGNAGYNQDLGIFVSDNGGADQLLAWKESGGFAGTFSPNAAYVQYLYNMTSGHTYIFKVKWKTNKNAPGATIYAGAGSGPYSPTSLIAETFPTGAGPNFAVSTTQYTLAGSNGSWQNIDATNLSTTLAPGANATAVLGANADLFTGKTGYNQDFGIFVSDNGGADALVAWKESGGFAGTFSPNAAFVKATYAMTSGHTYVFKLKWKTNQNAPGATIYAGAGNGPYSPTSLVAQSIAAGANPYTAASTSQHFLASSNGATWQTMDAALNVTVSPSADTNSIVGANADLFTANAGYNQDLGIFVSDNGGADVLLAWKESGGFAGTFSPNAAYAQTTYQMTSGHTYVFKLKWKTNKNAAGATIFAGAGSGPFSPTRLIVELTN